MTKATVNLHLQPHKIPVIEPTCRIWCYHFHIRTWTRYFIDIYTKMRSVSQVVQKLTLTHDLDLDSITFITEPELDIVMIYLNNKNEANRSSRSRVRTAMTLTLIHDLDLWPITFLSERGLDMMMTYLHTKNDISRSSSSNDHKLQQPWNWPWPMTLIFDLSSSY